MSPTLQQAHKCFIQTLSSSQAKMKWCQQAQQTAVAHVLLIQKQAPGTALAKQPQKQMRPKDIPTQQSGRHLSFQHYLLLAPGIWSWAGWACWYKGRLLRCQLLLHSYLHPWWTLGQNNLHWWWLHCCSWCLEGDQFIGTSSRPVIIKYQLLEQALLQWEIAEL